MLKFIQNIGDYFSSNYFDEDFTAKVLAKTGYAAEDIKTFNQRITPLKDKYYRFKQLFIEGKLRVKDKIVESHQFHTLVLNALGYDGEHNHYDTPFHLSEQEVIPVRHILYRGDQPHLMIMEMQALIKEDDTEPDGLFEQRYNVETEEQTNPPQRYHRSQWEDVFKVPAHLKISPVVINKAISELFLLEQHVRPKYILLLAGNRVFLLEQEKWFRGSYLQIDLEELFSEATASRNANYYALFYFLLGKETLAPESNIVLLDQLDEDSHKSAYEVTKDLKEGIIHAVEALANEALYYRKEKLHQNFDETDDVFEQEVKDDCLKIIYRLLFIFYAESREDLDILPSNDSIYQRGYSLEMLRDLEQVPMYSESSRNGYFFHESLFRLFQVLSSGYREKENGNNKSFKVRHIDSPLFNDASLKQLKGVQFRNWVWQDIISRLSLSKQQRGKSRGRISYANLGINQLGSVYESLLAYRGFYAEQDYIEVHKANDAKEGTYLVPRSRRDDFEENEILKDGDGQAVIIRRGTFVYRLSGRDRQKSASYYTPEVLTQCTVKYTLKPILEKLDKGEMKATELLELKLLEPAMGAAAFHNEMINQLAEAYLSYRQEELKMAGRTAWKVQPDKYREELQKVKAFIATNNVYGVDLNPTAIELGKLSLWLNVIHKDMETPFFSNRLAVGNAVVGSWFKVYKEKELLEEYEIVKDAKGKSKKVLVKKEWWNTAPRQLVFNPNTDYAKVKHGRKQDEIYHFLLPDANMVASAGIKLLKEEYDKEAKAVTKWRKDWTVPLKKSEAELLRKICNTIDLLLADYYRFQRAINLQTASRQSIFEAHKKSEQVAMAMRSYDEKERLADQRNRHNAPYFKLKMVMDYWCSLWFWDVREARELPSRQQYWQDIAGILEMDVNKFVEEDEEDFIVEESLAENSNTQTEMRFEEVIVEHSSRRDLFDNNQRLLVVSQLARQYHFFHPQLEFLEVFWERGGFDLIAGNPPWLKILFEEKDVLSEKFPELVMRSTSAPQVRSKRTLFFSDIRLKFQFLKDQIEVESAGVFMNSYQNYFLLAGQQTNLYKCILQNCLYLLNNEGYIGLLHPESIYDDPNGQSLRKEIYPRLKFHFQFQNKKMLFSEIKDKITYSINVYAGKKTSILFDSISNLYHPNTIYSCYSHEGSGPVPGMKKKNDSNSKFEWNINGHRDRIIQYDTGRLKKIKDIFGQDDNYDALKLVAIYSKKSFEILEKFQSFTSRLASYDYKISEGLHETNELASSNNPEGLIRELIKFPDIENYELILSGPHFFVANPLYRTPNLEVNNHNDFDVIDLKEITDDFLPRTKYIPAQKTEQYITRQGVFKKESWVNLYKVACSKMVDSMSERTLQSCIIPPKVSHVNGIISVVVEKISDLVELAGITHSVVLDFYLKTLASTNLYESRLRTFPLGLHEKYKKELIVRTLRLNSVNKYYTSLWTELYDDSFREIIWSKNDSRLSPFKNLTEDWELSTTPLKNFYERRYALIEIDVIVAMGIGLCFDDLISLYNIQFSVLQRFEDSTFYDLNGDIVFTSNSQGLKGIGVNSSVWENIKNLNCGSFFEHTITKSELYYGKKIVYAAPFDKCDRVEDYKLAWQHFEKIFSKEE